MEVNILEVGKLDTNCYIITNNNHALIIDPGDEADKIISFIEDKKLIVDEIIITHNHFDHIGALNEVKEKFNVPVKDKNNLEEKEYKTTNFTYKVIYTPGHTNDSITLYFEEENIMFVGDFIFENGIGRTDLPTGNMKEMINSLYKMKKYYKDIIVFPGHGNNTILGKELLKW